MKKSLLFLTFLLSISLIGCHSNYLNNNLICRENDGAYYSFKSADYEDLEVGMKVIVHWDGYQEDSDPPQCDAESIDIVTE